MKKFAIWAAAVLGAQMLPFAARGADMSVYQKAAVPTPVLGWSGLYVGGNVAGVRGDGTASDSLYGLSASSVESGIAGGGQLGFNLQYGFFVIGVEGDIDEADLNSTGPPSATKLGTLVESTNVDLLATLAARFGVTYGPLLFYGKVGGGWVESTAGATNVTKSTVISASSTNSGETWGVGAEWAFSPNWSLKLEYDYIRPHSWTFAGGSAFANDTFAVNRNVQMMKFGANYRFNWFGWGYAAY